MSSPKIGSLSKGEGKKVKTMSVAELQSYARVGRNGPDRAKAITELTRRGIAIAS